MGIGVIALRFYMYSCYSKKSCSKQKQDKGQDKNRAESRLQNLYNLVNKTLTKIIKNTTSNFKMVRLLIDKKVNIKLKKNDGSLTQGSIRKGRNTERGDKVITFKD